MSITASIVINFSPDSGGGGISDVEMTQLIRETINRCSRSMQARVEEMQRIIDSLTDPLQIAHWQERLNNERAKPAVRACYDEQLDLLRESGADPAIVEALESELKSILGDPRYVAPPKEVVALQTRRDYSISISVSRSLSCLVGYDRKMPSKMPDLDTIHVVESGLITVEVSSWADPVVNFYGRGIFGFVDLGMSSDNSGNRVWRYSANYKYEASDFALNGPGTDLVLVNRADDFITVTAKTDRGSANIRTSRQVEMRDETKPTVARAKQEVYTKYRVFQVFPIWDVEKASGEYYEERKPTKIVYRVELVFVDPKTGARAGNAGYEYRTEQFDVQPPVGNYNQLADLEIGEDPTQDGALWA